MTDLTDKELLQESRDSEMRMLQQISLMLAAIVQAGMQVNRLIIAISAVGFISFAQIIFVVWLILGDHLK